MLTGSRPFLFLFIVTVLAAGASLLYLTNVANSAGEPVSTEFPALTGTMSGEFGTLARNMVDSRVFSLSTSTPLEPDAWRTPGYPAFLAPFYALLGSFYPVLIAQVIILYLTLLLLNAMAQKFMDRRWAFALTLLYLLLPGTLLAVASLLTETLFIFCFMLAVYLCFFSRWQGEFVRFAIAGLLLAVATYIRPASLYIIPFFIGAYLVFFIGWGSITRRHLTALALLSVVFVAALLPWYYRNYEVFDHFSFASTGPFVLFRQNAVQFYESLTDVSNIEARYTLLERAGFPPGPVPMDFASGAALKEVAIEVISEHPVRYAIFHLSTFLQFFLSSGAQNYWFFAEALHPTFDPEPEPSLIQALYPFSLPMLLTVLENHGWTLAENMFWGIITLLMIIGLWRSPNRRLAWVLFSFTMYFALVTGPIAHARYRMPVEPFILMTAFGAASLINQNRMRGRKLFAPPELRRFD
ncbi:MAG: 2 protein [Patescibacteria group bacterium]|nr:2 protein [Patescibacteria group bacterium]